MAVFFNLQDGGILNMAASLNIKMAGITRWKYFKYGDTF
jgi:hypothetical protein